VKHRNKRSCDCPIPIGTPGRWILQPRFAHSTTSKTSRRRQKDVFSARKPNKRRYGRVSCQAGLPEGRSDQPQETNRDEILALGLLVGSSHRLSLLYPNVQPRRNTIPYLANHGILFMVALLIGGHSPVLFTEDAFQYSTCHRQLSPSII
jgi:hypothetical protein